MPRPGLLIVVLALAGCSSALLDAEAGAPRSAPDGPALVVLGIAQDGGVPQTGDADAPGWTHPDRRRLVVSLGLVHPASGRRWLVEATPDLPEQLAHLERVAPRTDGAVLDGVFLTHAHIGHYTGLMFLGHESLGARGVPVFAMPRMADFLRTNGPWSQLVRFENVDLRELADGTAVPLAEGLTVTPFLVPHRQEFSEVVGYRIDGPRRSVLFIPDIDSWHEWEAAGTRLEDALATVDVAYLDATFFADGEIGGRDMSGFPHPFITTTMARLAGLPASERGKVRFIHLNHTNPALWPGPAREAIEAAGMRVAAEGETVSL
ncbi:MBL fold metallo-hydrolase [Rubrivirga sp. IMCC43871]|uniref:MBL fold metallo-hydrolase n=1 Tax=Rubrivirga sp. IMCC43871 TaxID=3391575 RepID=UPI00398FF41B